MMPNERPEKEEEVTPKGAVEVNEEELDQAAGGLSLNFNKFEFADKKIAPDTIVGAGPGAGPHVTDPKWKI
jgi:hypothetical protein